jgi:hypothetical protein
VSDYPNTARGDVDFWGLTHVQAARYHARLSRMHADACGRFADLATMHARKAEIAARIGVGFALTSLAITIARQVIG